MKKIHAIILLSFCVLISKAQCPINVSGNATICMGQSTTLTAASTATSYTWNPGGINSPSVTVNPSVSTTYTVIGTDGICTDSTIVTVTVTSNPTISFSYTNSTCGGACDGAIAASVSGGTAAYTFTWSPIGANSPYIQSLCQGSYTCVVVDANGCMGANVSFLAANNPIIYSSVIPSACGQSNGSITVDSVYTAGFYLYNINGGTYTSNNIFSNLAAGNYTVGVNDSACIGTAVVSVNDSNFSVILTPTPPTCNMCDGSLSTAINGGTGPYTYTWSTGASTPSINALCTGNYMVSVTDNAGCFSSTAMHLSPPAAPVIHVDTIVNITCNGVTTGSASVSVTGGASPYTYSWNTTPVQTTANATNLQVGMYYVTVTDNAGCTSSQAVYVANSLNVYLYQVSSQPPNCGVNGSATVSGGGGTAPYTFSWSNGATGSTASNLAPGMYTITVTDASGCKSTGYINLYTQCMNVVKGRIYFDANQNCIQDVGEPGIAGRYVGASGMYATTDLNGDYVLFTPSMTNTVTVSSYGQPYLSPTCPSTGSLSATFSQLGDSLAGNDFGYWADPNYFDLSIHPGFTSANPGMPKNYWIYYENNSALAQNVLLRLTYDPQLQYTSCNSGGVHYPVQHKIEWAFNNVAPGKPWDWTNDPRAYFTVPSSVPITANLTSLFEILPIAGDAYPNDNTVNTVDPVTGSRDPNSKSVFPNGNILQTDSVLLYTVHFQNNGNDTAYRVVVIDTLSAFLDPASIDPGAASHPYTFSLSGQGICTWTFDSIMLPDSLTNEPASNGYFTFTIKQKANNPIGTVINNTADIYFDFNSAIITNTTVNTVVTSVSVAENAFHSANSFVIYPNPASEQVVLRYSVANNGPVTLELRNILGELVRSQTLYNKQKGMQSDDMNVSGLKNGVYLVRVLQGDQQQSQKLIIQK